jgi:hypothetical protein
MEFLLKRARATGFMLLVLLGVAFGVTSYQEGQRAVL